MVRDQALFASGQLVEQLGGPSVRPYQPPGLWSELTGSEDYQHGTGADLVRRSLYTFWRRTVAPANMFDVPNRQTCRVRSETTSTPLHALTTLNDPTWVEAARALAGRAMNESESLDDRRDLRMPRGDHGLEVVRGE